MEQVENFFDKFGLMAGPGADKKRMVIGGLSVGFILTYLKPNMFFHEGEVRPWSWTASNDKEKEHATSFTLWHAMAIGAFCAGVLV